jgi:myo-inositol 2-dehydrogenase / D-chiro-inositol 1-dehydrogenase
MLEMALFGAGRIGQIHAANVARAEGARLRYVADVSTEAAHRIASKYGAEAIGDPARALADSSIGAVIIASPTNTHVDLIIAAARAKKAIFCEKPIDLDLLRVDIAIAEVQLTGVPFFVGFNRRFDPSFERLASELRSGAIGKLEQLTIVSRDPGPPPRAYVEVSGGLFRDMMIHDLDMARWLLGEEPVSLYATASCLVEPFIGELGDVDSAMVIMKTASGAMCHIQNSRRAAYGYDQRIEILGEKGMLQAGNWRETTVERWTKTSVESDKPPLFFLERYEAAYRREMAHFIDKVIHAKGAGLSVGAQDGRRALVLAEAALASLKSKSPVEVR